MAVNAIYDLSRSVVHDDSQVDRLKVQKMDEDKRTSMLDPHDIQGSARTPSPAYQPMQRALMDAAEKVKIGLPKNADKLKARGCCLRKSRGYCKIFSCDSVVIVVI